MYSFQDVQTSLKFEQNQQINVYMNEAYTRIAIIMCHVILNNIYRNHIYLLLICIIHFHVFIHVIPSFNSLAIFITIYFKQVAITHLLWTILFTERKRKNKSMYI